MRQVARMLTSHVEALSEGRLFTTLVGAASRLPGCVPAGILLVTARKEFLPRCFCSVPATRRTRSGIALLPGTARLPPPERCASSRRTGIFHQKNLHNKTPAPVPATRHGSKRPWLGRLRR